MTKPKPELIEDLTDQEKRDLLVAIGLDPEPRPRPIIEVDESTVQFKSVEEVSDALSRMALAGIVETLDCLEHQSPTLSPKSHDTVLPGFRYSLP